MKPKSQKEYAEEMFPTPPIEQMALAELQIRLTALSIPATKTSDLFRWLYRIVRFPEDTLVLNGYRKIIERELDRRHSGRVLYVSVASSAIALFGVLVALFSPFRSRHSESAASPQTIQAAPVATQLLAPRAIPSTVPAADTPAPATKPVAPQNP